MDRWNIHEGAEVRSADDEKLGKVIAIEGQYLVVEKGFFFPTDYYIPTSAISSADGDTIRLAVGKDEALNSGWDQAAATDTGVGYTDTAAAGYAGTTAAPDRDMAATDYDRTDYDTERRDYAAETTGEDVLRVPVHEEELTASKRKVDQGKVRVEKDVVAEDRVMDVPVTEERVRVTRRDVDRPVGADEAAFEEGTIDVPLRGEEVDVQKRVRVDEEVEIAKEATQRNKRVEGTVRREEVHIDDETVDTTTS